MPFASPGNLDITGKMAQSHFLDYDLNGAYTLNRGSTLKFDVIKENVNYTFLVGVRNVGFYYGADNAAEIPKYTDLLSNVSPYGFDSGSMGVIISLSMCCVVIWSVFVSAFLSRKDRPYLQLFTFLYVAVILTVHFAVTINFFFHQNASGYLSSRDWFDAKVAGSDVLSGLLLSCFSLALIVEVHLIKIMASYKWTKRIVLVFGAVFVVVDTVLWGLSFVNEWGMHNLPYYLEVWNGFELGMQGIMFIVVALWAISCYRYAFSIPTCGVAMLSLLGCAAPIVTTAFTFSSDIYYIYLTATLCARCWACMMVFTWNSSVRHNILKERTVGDLGAQISSRTAKSYTFAGDGTSSGDMSYIQRYGAFFNWAFGPSYQVRGVTVETRDRPSFETAPANIGPVHTYPLRSAIPQSSDTPEYSAVQVSPNSSPPPPTPPVPGPSTSPPAILGPGPSNIPGSAANPSLPGIDEEAEADEEDDLPAFVPHPRFHIGDYWDEKRNRHF